MSYSKWKDFKDNRKLYIFDFDDTLVKTDSEIILKRGGETFTLDSDEYLEYTAQPDDELDLSQFDTLINPTIINKVFHIFKKQVQNPNSDVVILTARNNKISNDIYNFLQRHQIDRYDISDVVGVGDRENPSSIEKAMWIEEKISDANYQKVYFFDDSLNTRMEVEFLEDKINKDLKNKIDFHVINPEDLY